LSNFLRTLLPSSPYLVNPIAAVFAIGALPFAPNQREAELLP
jgi:hypothetical protein